MGKLKFIATFILTAFTTQAFGDNTRYLYSSVDIPVHQTADPSSPVMYTIHEHDGFQIEKWNNYNTRIRLPDGRLGWIDKDYVSYLAPANDPGYLPQPLGLVSTHDQTYKPSSTEYLNTYNGNNADGNGSGEVVTGQPEDSVTADDIDPDVVAPGHEEALNGVDDDFMTNLGLDVWKEATRTRRRASYLRAHGGAEYGSGNVSKGMCAAAAMDAMKSSGLCRVRPSSPDALHLFTAGAINKNTCPRLHLTGKLNPYNAPGASVIVYRGYAGHIRHNFGHVEIKIPVTQALKTRMGHQAANLKVGDFLYCSDFCSPHPTMRPTNAVVAIYSL